MSISHKGSKKITMRCCAKAAVVAALLPTLGAAQGIGDPMPDNCKQNLDQCSQRIWKRNSFPHPEYSKA
jgi:hypothetical protein